MKFLSTLCFGVATALFSYEAIATTAFTDEQIAQIENIAGQYLTNHPEIVVKALEKLQAEQEQKQLDTIKKTGEFYRQDVNTPSIGDKNAQHYLVDIYDYNCGYCKNIEPFIKELAEDKELSIQVVHVNVPVISESSAMSATIAQAIFNIFPDKFALFHDKIMIDKINPNDLEVLKKAAEDIGCDWKKVTEELESRRPQQKISADLRRIREMGLTGTPYLIIDGRGYPGAVRSVDDLKARLSNN